MKPLPYGSMVDSSGQLVTMLPPDVDPKQWFAAKRQKQSVRESYSGSYDNHRRRDSYDDHHRSYSPGYRESSPGYRESSPGYRESSPGYRIHDYEDSGETRIQTSNRYSYHEEKTRGNYDYSSEDDVRLNGYSQNFNSSTLPASNKKIKNQNKSYEDDTWANRTSTLNKPDKKRSEYLALAALQGTRSQSHFDIDEGPDINHNSYHVSREKSFTTKQRDSREDLNKSHTSFHRESSPGYIKQNIPKITPPGRVPEIVITSHRESSSPLRYRNSSPDRPVDKREPDYFYERPSQAKLNQVNALVARFNEEAKRKIELRKDLEYQPPLPSALKEPSSVTANNNNRPFSYLSGSPPGISSVTDKRASLSPPKDIVYAQVVMDEEEKKRTVHSRISPGHDSDYDSLVRRENRKNRSLSQDESRLATPHRPNTTTVVIGNNEVKSIDSKRSYSFNTEARTLDRKVRSNYPNRSRDSSEEKENRPSGRYYYGSDSTERAKKLPNGTALPNEPSKHHNVSYFRSLDTRRYDKRDSEVDSVHEVFTKSNKVMKRFEDPIAKLEDHSRRVRPTKSFHEELLSERERLQNHDLDNKKIANVVDEQGRSDSDIENLRGYTEYKGERKESVEHGEDNDIMIIENKAKTTREKKPAKTKHGFFSNLFHKKGSKDKVAQQKNKKPSKDIHLKVDLKTPWDKEKEKGELDGSHNEKHLRENDIKNAEESDRKTKIKKSKSFMSHSSKLSEGESPAFSSSETEERRRYHARRAKVTRSASSGATLSTKRRMHKHVNRGTNSSSGPMSVNSSESDASHFSQNSNSSTRSHFLHTTMVADIPPAASMLKASRSKPDVSSKEPQRKHVSRSVSLLAPWKPRHYRDRYEISYEHERMPSPSANGRPPRPPRRKQTHSPRETSSGHHSKPNHQPHSKDSKIVGWFKRKKEPTRDDSHNP